MTPSARRRLFVVSAGAVALGLVSGFAELPPFGVYAGPYGDLVNATAVSSRHVTNIPSAVNFDYRALDTLGEETILFVAVMGLGVLFREQGRRRKRHTDNRPMTETARWTGLVLFGVTMVLGATILLHGHLTPGGGFQGGVILALSTLVGYVTLGRTAFRRLTERTWLQSAEAAGVGLYVLIGLTMLLMGGALLENRLPLGEPRELFSGGSIVLLNIATGIEVTAAFVLLMLEFLDETEKPARE